MSVEYFERFFVFTAVGLGLLVVGALNLALSGSGRRVWVRAAGSLVVCGLAIAGLAALTRPELVLQTAGVLLGVVTVAGLLGSEWFARQLAVLLTAARKPTARWGLVSVGGLAVVLTGAVAFERTDSAATDQTMKELEAALTPPATHPSADSATTDRGAQVVLRLIDAPRDAGTLADTEERMLRGTPYYRKLIRLSDSTDASNCHGWVFTGGRYFIASESVEAILKDNGYQEVPTPQPGDLAVYRQAEKVSHTAIVRYVAEGRTAMVEGKWGVLGVYQHAVNESIYGKDYTFYRSSRNGHVLAGLGGSGEAPAANTE